MIDYLNCTMADVIARSAAMHPSLLAESLDHVASVHRQAADTMRYHSEGGAVARKMAAQAHHMAGMARDEMLAIGGLTLGEKVIAFGVASRLLCIPPACARDIAAREG